MKENKLGPVLIADHANGRNNNFNLIRMLAASGVLVSHAYPISSGLDTLEPFEVILKGDNLGRVCVFVFFAISGFFIAQSFSRKRDLGTFIAARALRLFPALAVMLIVTLLVSGLFLTTAPAAEFWLSAPGYFLNNITLQFLDIFGFLDFDAKLLGMFEQNSVPAAINGSLWSLPFEVMCYVGVMIAGMLGLLARPKVFAIGLVLFGIGYLLRIVALDLGFKLPFVLSRLAYIGFPFVMGTAFWVWRDSIQLSLRMAGVLIVLAIISWPSLLFLPMFTIALVYSVFLLGYAQSPRFQQYNRLGDYSYGIYIYAFPVQQMFASFGVTSPVLNMLLAFPVVLICAILSWHLIEKPSLGFRSGFKRRQPSSAEA